MANQLVASSSFPPSWKYDVFLSFRGEDTRTNFTDHLYNALVNKRIKTFIDRELRRGEEIAPALLKAIEESRISLVIFSQTYASSSWCLEELVRILQCKDSKQQIVLPVFYKVEPSHVRKQESSFGKAFTELVSKSGNNNEKVPVWKSALTEVANLSGFPVKEGDYETTIINDIVNDILVRVPDGTYVKGSHQRKKSIDRLQTTLDSYDSYKGEPFRDIQRVLQKSYDAWDDVVQQVSLDMSHKGMRQLKGFKNSAEFTSMNFRGCEFLQKIPDLSGSPNLKHLVLSDCKSLVDVDDSIGYLDKLVYLNLNGCSKLKRFVTRLGLRSLECLYLKGCTRLESFPEIEEGKMESLTDLDIRQSGIRELPSSIAYLTGLQRLKANECENLTGTSLHHIYGLQDLIQAHFGKCPKLVTFGNHEVQFDEVSSCNSITLALPNLFDLDLGGCNLSKSDFLVPLGCWFALASLDLSRNNFVSLPDCINKFVNLVKLRLSGCRRLRKIPQVLPPSLCDLYLDDCASLEKIPKLPPMLERLELTNCIKLSGDEVAKLKKNWLNEESFQRAELQVILPDTEVQKWPSYTP
ncbi:disease resistance protein RUN1-like [Pyrus x bretschneideri]|uniref:disease resistance protein RUN1-like n=1 Tax=Pyrus x bretschneideri TaxID=225117 RepID=UPI00202DB9F9|nr:disease resistance protein RUN1-like [Pyrus x bretschneideri]